jgi:hypothetical protein
MITDFLTKALVKRQSQRESTQHHRELKQLSNHLLEDIGLSCIDSGSGVKHLLWDHKKKVRQAVQQHNPPVTASHTKICAFGKCFQY